MNRLLWLLRQIITSLPQKRDWLDPDLEREAKEILKQPELKLWIQDLGYRGGIVVAAYTEQEARELMDKKSGGGKIGFNDYDPNRPLVAHHFAPGMFVEFFGDR